MTAVAGKTCSAECGLWKPLGEFGRDARGALGRQARCRTCCNAEKRAYLAANSYKVNAQRSARRAADPDKANAQRSAHRAAARDKYNARAREYYANNKEVVDARQRERYARRKPAPRKALADKIWDDALADDQVPRGSIL